MPNIYLFKLTVKNKKKTPYIIFWQILYYNQQLRILIFSVKQNIILPPLVIQYFQIYHYFKEDGAYLLTASLWGDHRESQTQGRKNTINILHSQSPDFLFKYWKYY